MYTVDVYILIQITVSYKRIYALDLIQAAGNIRYCNSLGKKLKNLRKYLFFFPEISV